jgi:CrcB protein
VAATTGPDGRFLVSPVVRQTVMVGVLGGFTTFSAFSLQTLLLARQSEWMYAAANVGLSLVLCLMAVWAGWLLGLAVNR